MFGSYQKSLIQRMQDALERAEQGLKIKQAELAALEALYIEAATADPAEDTRFYRLRMYDCIRSINGFENSINTTQANMDIEKGYKPVNRKLLRLGAAIG